MEKIKCAILGVTKPGYHTAEAMNYRKVGRKVGNEQIIGKYTPDASNDGGRMLTEILTKLGLRERTIMDLERFYGLVHNQIDFTCSPPSPTVLGCEVINNFLFISDRRLIRMQMIVRNNVGRTLIRPYRSPLTRLYLDRELYKVRLSLLPNQPCPQNAQQAYESIRSFVENAADGCWSIQTGPPRISFRTQTLLSERITLRNNSSSVGRIAYSIICKASRLALLEDIRQRKTIIVQKATERGRSMIEAQRKGILRNRRLLIKDSTTGEFSQRATETAVVSYYNNFVDQPSTFL
ncbi:unnamed protein product [Haemonchus placei]|uniref:Transposase n=1 Tax=Haemonchus placei TaxID=6290 RepID=A0A0N4WW03_HAEPC|nr:unnamed protein product [Haemonchus placei]